MPKEKVIILRFKDSGLLDAVRFIRSTMGVGLKEARDMVEGVMIDVSREDSVRAWEQCKALEKQNLLERLGNEG